MKFQVAVTVTATGYLELDAADEEAARKAAQVLTPGIDWGMFSEIDTTLFDSNGEVQIDGVYEVEDEEEKTA